jgi:hypothetical protein
MKWAEGVTDNLLAWRNVNLAAEESTEIDVLFEPTNTGTRVTVQHRVVGHQTGPPSGYGVESGVQPDDRAVAGELITSPREFIETRAE